ncbi:MAG: DUF6364 family protein [Balneolaceae bacterium]|nr:DUF6364 family protein [Balneolaceae bacterium]
MKEKLNLTIEREVKERAKKLAKERGISVSKMVEKMLKSVSAPNDNWTPKEGSIVSQMSGSIPAPEGIEYDELLTEARLEKEGYGKNID